MISIIIPTFNRSNSILVAINSILNRCKKNIEIVIVDDASDDDTEQKIKSLNNQSITYIKNKSNIGTALSKLRGIEVASGNYIGFLDDDDIWTSNAIDLSSDIILLAHSFPVWFPMLDSSVSKLPPNLDLSSAKITLAPFFAAAYALANPDGPDPAINRSQYSYLCS